MQFLFLFFNLWGYMVVVSLAELCVGGEAKGKGAAFPKTKTKKGKEKQNQNQNQKGAQGTSFSK